MLEQLRERLDEPTSRGLAHAVSAAISDGALGDGDRLPPIRTVATSLQLSPTTVSAAWSLLVRAGTIRTDGRRGTTVAQRRTAGPGRYRRALERPASFPVDLSTGVPDPQLLPDLSPSLHRLRGTTEPGSYLDHPVVPALEQALRSGWPYPPERMTIVDGAMDALDQISSVLLRFGDKVAVENPCFPPLLDLLDACGVGMIGVDVDAEGLSPDGLDRALADGARMVFLQPRAQNPTGASMTPGRAQRLSTLVGQAGAIAVEDDSAGGVASSPAISLGRWLPERTLHVRSFSKSHGPDLRLAAVSGPADLVDPIVERRYLGQGWTSRLLQTILLDLLTSPRAVQQVDRARQAYADRRTAVVDELRRHGIDSPSGDGLNLWLPVQDEAAALVRLASRGIGAAAGSPFAVTTGKQAHLRVTVGLVRSDYEQIAGELAEAARVGGWTGPR
ncbi:MAG: PLP-dependent aminotransferase family protein [Jatrophihabitans sp.]